MPSQHLTTSTAVQAGLFSGALSQHSMPPFDPEQFRNDPWFVLDEWESDDSTFRNHMYVTTSTLPEVLSERTMWQLASHMIINRLADDVLKTAFESLADVYRWQVERSQVVFSEPEIEVVQTAPTVRYVERHPFDVPE